MKKLNRKGFTLIELLAIIVILAIIMVVTIPTVLSSMGTAREEMFQNSVDSVADWVEKQYGLATFQTPATDFTGICKKEFTSSDGENTVTTTNDYCSETNAIVNITGEQKTLADVTAANNFLKAAGVDPKNYSKMEVKITNGRACVKLTASSTGDFKDYTGEKSSTGC